MRAQGVESTLDELEVGARHQQAVSSHRTKRVPVPIDHSLQYLAEAGREGELFGLCATLGDKGGQRVEFGRSDAAVTVPNQPKEGSLEGYLATKRQ